MTETTLAGAGEPAPVIAANERVAVVAKTRSGKSVWVRALVRSVRTQVLVIDTKGEIDYLTDGVDKRGRPIKVHRFRGPQGLNFDKHRINVYVPADPDDTKETEKVFAEAFKRTNLTTWIDESYPITTANTCPKSLRLMLIQGAALNHRVLACMQRPVHIEKNLLAQASHIVVFHKGFAPEDADTLAKYMGLTAPELRAEIAYIRQVYGAHAHLHYDEGTHVLHRRPRLPEWMIQP